MNLRARLRKIILWSAAISSVLLAVVWIGSVWGKIESGIEHGPFVCLQGGCLGFWEADLTFFPESGFFLFSERRSAEIDWEFRWNFQPKTGYLIIPLWAPLAVTSAIAVFAWRKEVIARRRANQHKCPACGYEMTGLAATAPCPECGKTAS